MFALLDRLARTGGTESRPDGPGGSGALPVVTFSPPVPTTPYRPTVGVAATPHARTATTIDHGAPAGSRSHPSPDVVSSGPAPGRLGGPIAPPVGLAGLVDWWQARSDGGDRPTHPGVDGPTGSTHPEPSPDHGPTASEPWSGGDPYADADQFRDALERLLLDEALADGLEVSDGPA